MVTAFACWRLPARWLGKRRVLDLVLGAPPHPARGERAIFDERLERELGRPQGHPELLRRLLCALTPAPREESEHPVVGRAALPTVPFRYASVERWLRNPAPTLGQHNREILGRLLGLSDAELDRLEADGVIGTEMEGA